jgi:hypothetical protein
MSTTLSAPDLAPSSTAVAAPEATVAGRIFPVGARFPRRTADAELAYLTSPRTVGYPSARVFPIGARFPRRSAEDAVVYLAERAASAGMVVTATRRVLPVGARFPRH